MTRPLIKDYSELAHRLEVLADRAVGSRQERLWNLWEAARALDRLRELRGYYLTAGDAGWEWWDGDIQQEADGLRADLRGFLTAAAECGRSVSHDLTEMA